MKFINLYDFSVGFQFFLTRIITYNCLLSVLLVCVYTHTCIYTVIYSCTAVCADYNTHTNQPWILCALL